MLCNTSCGTFLCKGLFKYFVHGIYRPAVKNLMKEKALENKLPWDFL